MPAGSRVRFENDAMHALSNALRLAIKAIVERKNQLAVLFACVLAPLFLLGQLSEEVLENEPFPIDSRLLAWAHGIGSETLDSLMLLASFMGSGWVVGTVDVAVAAFLLRRRRIAASAFWMLAVGGAAVLNWAGKHTFARQRPSLWPSIAPETTFSFPSGHAMQTSAFVIATVLLLKNPQWRAGAVALGLPYVLLVGFSRVYLGVHYPTDVLAGWCASFAWTGGLHLVMSGRWLGTRVNEE